MSEASDFRIFGTSVRGGAVNPVLHDPAVATIGEKLRYLRIFAAAQGKSPREVQALRHLLRRHRPNIRYSPRIRLLCGLFRFCRMDKVECLPPRPLIAGSSRYQPTIQLVALSAFTLRVKSPFLNIHHLAERAFDESLAVSSFHSIPHLLGRLVCGGC